MPLAHLSSELSRVLAADGRVDLALLFGSQSRGTATSASDVDVAVRAPFVALDELAATLSAALGMEVDVVSLDEVNIPLKEALIRDSVVVFERVPIETGHFSAEIESGDIGNKLCATDPFDTMSLLS
jgi:predicted nucleotidyltransferase